MVNLSTAEVHHPAHQNWDTVIARQDFGLVLYSTRTKVYLRVGSRAATLGFPATVDTCGILNSRPVRAAYGTPSLCVR